MKIRKHNNNKTVASDSIIEIYNIAIEFYIKLLYKCKFIYARYL